MDLFSNPELRKKGSIQGTLPSAALRLDSEATPPTTMRELYLQRVAWIRDFMKLVDDTREHPHPNPVRGFARWVGLSTGSVRKFANGQRRLPENAIDTIRAVVETTGGHSLRMKVILPEWEPAAARNFQKKDLDRRRTVHQIDPDAKSSEIVEMARYIRLPKGAVVNRDSEGRINKISFPKNNK